MLRLLLKALKGTEGYRILIQFHPSQPFQLGVLDHVDTRLAHTTGKRRARALQVKVT